MFVGYLDKVKGYKIWCGEAHKCLINRDVRFYKAAIISNSNQAASDTDINANKNKLQKTLVKVLRLR